MSVITRSVTIQVRVVPAIKQASEEVLERMGLNMSEAVELFLRRLIVDERLPFDVVALSEGQAEPSLPEGEARVIREQDDPRASKSGDRRSKKFKTISGGQSARVVYD